MAADDGRGFKIASAYVSVGLNEDQLDGDIAALNSKLAGIRDAQIGAGINQGALDAEIAEVQAKLDSLAAKAGAGINEEEFDAEYADLNAKLDALAAKKVNIRVGLSDTQVIGELSGLAAVLKAIGDNADPLVAALTRLGQSEESTGTGASGAARNMGQLGESIAETANQASHLGGYMGMLTKEVTLFGGALGDAHMIGQIPLWHILMDGILETTIGLTEATIALGVFAAAAAPAAEQIYTHIQSVDDVVHALGVDIPPVTGHFHELQNAMAPQVIELYGAALNTMGNSGDNLARIVSKITTGFDDWMAKLDEFSAKQSHTDGIVAAGGDVLQQMSVILDELGVSFENLMKADPGTVHFILDVAQGAAKLVELFTEIPTPILYTTLALHSFLLWGGLLTTGITKILSPLSALYTGLGKLASAGAEAGVFGSRIATAAQSALIPMQDLRSEAGLAATELDKTAESGSKLPPVLSALNSAGVWGWAAVGAVALGGLVYWMTTADSATKAFIANLDNGLAQLNPGQAILQISTDIGSLDKQITTVGPHIQQLNEHTSSLITDTGRNMEGFAGAMSAVLSGNESQWTNVFAKVGASVETGAKALASWFGLIHENMDKTSDIDAYKGAIVSLTGDQTNLFHEVGNLMQVQTQYTSETSRAAAGIHAVGGSFTETTKSAYTYVQALALMSLAGVQASDSYALMKQKVDNLITGYEDMSVQGGMLANSVDAVTFSSEEQQSKISDLTQSWTSFISMVTGGLASFSTFETQMQGLDTAATTAGNTLSVSAGKTGLVTKAAGGASSALHGTTVALMGTSSASLQLQQTWVQAINDGNNLMNSLMMQASAAGMGAKGAALLTQAGKDMVAQLLPMADGSAEATAQLYALAQQAGYQGPDSFGKLTEWVGKTTNAEGNLQQIQAKLAVASADLTTDMENLAQAVGTQLNSAMAAAIFQASGGQKTFDAFATSALTSHDNISKMHDSALALATQLLDVTGNASQAHGEFDVFAAQLGITKGEADKLWGSVQKLATALSNIPKNVSSTVTITEDLIGATGGAGAASGSGGRAHAATGGQIRGGSGRARADDIPAMLSDREWVIQTPAVDKYGSQLFENLNAMRYADGGQAVAAASRAAASTTGPEYGGAPIVANFNYYGPQHPTPEMQQAMIMNLTSMVGLAG